MTEYDDIDEPQDQALSAADLKRLSPLDWARYGAQRIAYVRPVVVNGQAAIAIHAADGTPIGAAPSIALATAAIVQHGMGPALVH
ncbi:hypothetical protein [Roseomonas rosulenta]|uniref:hypothetical protein n=1 Tax=Roseomonas rosulenta TaxID=2748667 RepID=UPI0018E00D0A|nr:hypothetical protein [Roseomonas rosulenta]